MRAKKKISSYPSNRPWGPPNLHYNGYRDYLPVQNGRRLAFTTHPNLVPRISMNEGMSVFCPLLGVAYYGVTFTLTFISLRHSLKFMYVTVLGLKRFLLLHQLRRAASNEQQKD